MHGIASRHGKEAGCADFAIPAGDDLDGEINAELQAADVILLLISPDFLDSCNCYDVEVRAAIGRRHAGEARVIPVILRPCDWLSAACHLPSLAGDCYWPTIFYSLN